MQYSNRLWALGLAVLLQGCGGGGGGGGASVASDSSSTGVSAGAMSLSGSVSQGFPISGASVSLIDARGTRVSAGVTDSLGNYTVQDISGLQTPILVAATGVTGGRSVTMYGLLPSRLSRSVANVTPMTDAVVTQTIGASPSTLVNTPTAVANINTTAAENAATKLASAVSNVMEQLTPGSSNNFNPLSTPFVANGTSAADKVNDLVKVTSTLSPTGVVTDLTDKSGTVGTVSITNNSAVTKLPPLPAAAVNAVDVQAFNRTLERFNAAFVSVASMNSQALADLFDDSYLEDGLDKAAQLSLFRANTNLLVGTVFSNPVVNACKPDGVCSFALTAKGPVLNETLTTNARYDPVLRSYRIVGLQNKFRVELDSHLSRNINGKTGVATTYANLGVRINAIEESGWNAYLTATVNFQGPDGTVDLTYNYALRPNQCAPGLGYYYGGMPREDKPNDCWSGSSFDSSTESVLKRINQKIMAGGYKLVVRAWKNNTRSGTPDIAEIPISTPLMTTDRIGAEGYPKVNIVQGNNGSLPYLVIENAQDFTPYGSFCISRNIWCDVEKPQAGSTVILLNSHQTVPSRLDASTRDGWAPTDKAISYFVHVLDKAGRDLIIRQDNW